MARNSPQLQVNQYKQYVALYSVLAVSLIGSPRISAALECAEGGVRNLAQLNIQTH
jgi:hypothetical protein